MFLCCWNFSFRASLSLSTHTVEMALDIRITLMMRNNIPLEVAKTMMIEGMDLCAAVIASNIDRTSFGFPISRISMRPSDVYKTIFNNSSKQTIYLTRALILSLMQKDIAVISRIKIAIDTKTTQAKVLRKIFPVGCFFKETEMNFKKMFSNNSSSYSHKHAIVVNVKKRLSIK